MVLNPRPHPPTNYILVWVKYDYFTNSWDLRPNRAVFILPEGFELANLLLKEVPIKL